MLSGEGNENGEKTTIGLISKNATLHVQRNFFVYFFAVVLHDLMWNFQKPVADPGEGPGGPAPLSPYF